MNLTNQFGISPLHYACFFGSKKVIDLLLDLGADINARDQDGATCLHYAINRGCVKTIKKLLIRGADRTIRKNDGRTPYELALDTNNLEIAKILQETNFFKKYLCMDSPIEPFKPSRNDLVLVVSFLLVITFKLFYIFKIHSIINYSFYEPVFESDENQNNSSFMNSSRESIYASTDGKDIYFKNLVKCTIDEQCIFETVITVTSLFLNLITVFCIIYFMCCIGAHINSKNKKRRRYNNSLIVI